jgi:hypothetical protein
MKLPDLFSVVSANFQLNQKSNNDVTFQLLRSETRSTLADPAFFQTRSIRQPKL